MAGEDLSKLPAQTNPLYAILQAAPSLANIFLDKTTSQNQTTSGGTQTTKTDLSPDAVQALINKMLQDNSGLASISAGQKSAGMYNSNTNSLMMNDLLTKVASETALKSAPTTVTASPTSVSNTNVSKAQVDPMTALLTAGAGVLGKKLLNGVFSNGGIGGTGTIGDVASMATDIPSLMTNSADIFSALGSSSGDSQLSGAASLASTFLNNGGDLSGFLSGSSALTDAIGSIFSDSSASLFSGAGAGSAAALDGLGAVAGPVGAMLGVTSLLGGPSLGDIASGIGDVVDSLNPSVICTELNRQGLLANDIYRLDSEYGKHHISVETMTGYHLWAIPLTKIMRKSRLVTKLVSLLAIPWAIEMAHKQDRVGYSMSIVGKLVAAIGIPVCYCLGKLVFTIKGVTKSWASV
jgi:hypothetical protein